MSTRATVHVVNRPQPQLIPRPELERIRCEARSGIASALDTEALLTHIEIQHRVILQMAGRTEQCGTDEERARVRAALEQIDEPPPIHIRIEFDLPPATGGGFAALLAALHEWTLEEIAALVDAAHVTAVHRDQTESWETRLP